MSGTQPNTLRQEAQFTKESIVICGAESKARFISSSTPDGSKRISNNKRPQLLEYVLTGSVTTKRTFRQRKVLSSMAILLYKRTRSWEKWI
eukprot:15054143-Heterocapsa_arctica.AAC.1